MSSGPIGAATTPANPPFGWDGQGGLRGLMRAGAQQAGAQPAQQPWRGWQPQMQLGPQATTQSAPPAAQPNSFLHTYADGTTTHVLRSNDPLPQGLLAPPPEGYLYDSSGLVKKPPSQTRQATTQPVTQPTPFAGVRPYMNSRYLR